MKIFIAGPRAISKLNSKVTKRIDNIIENNFTILVGDANGIDKAIQKYCEEKNYKNVIVYAAGQGIRNNVGNWKTVNVHTEKGLKGFDFYKIKDEQMAKDADYGLMIWNGKSRGTFNNIVNLVKNKKKVLLFLNPIKEFYTIKTREDIEKLLLLTKDQNIIKFYEKEFNNDEQLVIGI